MFEKLVHLALVFTLCHSLAQTSEAATHMSKTSQFHSEYQDTNKAVSKLIAEVEALAKLRELKKLKLIYQNTQRLLEL